MNAALDRELAHRLRETLAALRKLLRKQVGDREQLSLAEENVVRLLMEQEKALPSELCAKLDISSQFMTQVLKRLEDLGYITRQVLKSDKRKSVITLSKTGWTKLHKRRQEKEDLLAGLVSARYTRQEKELIVKAIELLERLYEEDK